MGDNDVARQMGLLTVPEVAERLNLMPSSIRYMCRTERIEGAMQITGRWLIPESSLDKIIYKKPGRPRKELPFP